jgi:hypothetical protein
MSNLISFSIGKDLLDVKEIQPIPANLNFPNWYKKLKLFLDDNLEAITSRGCIPILDSLSAGYLLPMPQDMLIYHNIINHETKEKEQRIVFSNRFSNNFNINERTSKESHNINQVGGYDSYWAKKNNNYSIPKILNPWTIKTPPGYSCLFIPPLHREMDYFSVIPAIVDTDTFNTKINFPFVVNHDKYNELDKLIVLGTPYVQIIPFKRDSWKMIIEESKSDFTTNWFKYNLRMLYNYKNNYWSKKKWN